MRHIAQKLEKEMTRAVSLIVAASHAAAREALDEAFGAGSPGSPGSRQRDRSRTADVPRQRRQRRPSSPRRTGEQLAALEGQLLDAVWATPGEPMSALAPRIGVPRGALQVPVARLKAAGKLKTVGTRQFTRYFPAGRDGGSKAEAGG